MGDLVAHDCPDCRCWPRSAYGEIEDGFGSTWVKCSLACGLEVVRPGKVQCTTCEED